MCGEDVVIQMPPQEDERQDVHGGGVWACVLLCVCVLLCRREDKGGDKTCEWRNNTRASACAHS
jgi:hypothetical protein